MSAPQSSIPTRSNTVMTKSSSFGPGSDDDAIPGEDTSEVTRLFAERLQAWKHACGYFEDYIKATEKMEHGLSKDYEKVLKTVEKPLKEGHHFEQNVGGVAGLLDNVRSNTQAISNSHSETAKALKGSVLPTFERLHSEIKSKAKELVKGAGKGSKAVDKARNATQKHIELLGQHSASFDSSGGKITAADDPYVLSRGVMHRLNKQVLEENANRADLISVQDNFASFEAHVIQTMQSGLGQFNTIISKQSDISKSLYGDMVGTAQRVPVDYEWQGFLNRNGNVLIDPNAPERNINQISFPNQQHRSTIPLISGSLERKTKIMRKFETNYYVITPSKFFHEFKSDDDFAKDPSPEISLYLPDCVVGALDGAKFAIKGKDVSKSKIGVSMHTTHEYNFKAHTPMDAAKWNDVLKEAAGHITTDKMTIDSTPSSPAIQHSAEGEKFGAIAAASHTTPHTQESGTTGAVAPATSAADEKAALAAAERERAHAAGESSVSSRTTAAGTDTLAHGSGDPTTATHHDPTHVLPAPTSAEPSKS